MCSTSVAWIVQAASAQKDLAQHSVSRRKPFWRGSLPDPILEDRFEAVIVIALFALCWLDILRL